MKQEGRQSKPSANWRDGCSGMKIYHVLTDSDAFVIYLECDQESDKPSQVSRKSKDEFWRDLSGERVETIPHVFQLPAEQVYERAVSKLGKKKARAATMKSFSFQISSVSILPGNLSGASGRGWARSLFRQFRGEGPMYLIAFVNWCIEGEQVLNEDLGLLSSLLDCADVVHHRKDRSKCKVDSYILAEHGTNRTKKIYWTIHKKNSHAVLAFSGSQNIENWIQNLKFALRSPGELISKDVKVHHGFLEYIEELGKALSELYRQCETELASERAFIVYLVGHSLGGALASLAAACLVLNQKFSKITSKVMRVVTFGQPSVGDSAFAKLYNEIGLGSRTTRVMMSKDAVPDLPHTYVSWYRHVGTGIYADALLPRKAQRKSTWWSPLSWRVWKFSHLPAPHLLPAYRMAIDQKTHLEKICEAQSPTGKLSREKKKTSTNGDPSREPIFAKIVDASKNDSEAVLYNSRHMRQLGEMLRHIPKASHQMPENIAKIFKSDTKEVALSFCPPSPARGAATEMSGLVTLGSGLYYEKIKSDLRRELHSQTDEIKNEVRDCKQHMDDGFTHIKGTLAQMKETMELQTVQLSHIISGQEMTHRQLEKINSKLDEIPRLIQKSDKMKLAREYREHWNKVQHSYNRASQRGSDAHKSLKSVSKNMIFHIKSVLQTYCPNPGHQMRLPYVAGFVFASRARMDAFLFEAAPTHSYEASQGATKYDNYQRWDKTKVAEWLNKHDSPDVQDCSDQFLQEGINGSVLKELNIDEDYDNFFAEMKFGGVGRKRLLKKYIKSLENSPGKEVKEDHDALEFIREAANLIDEELSHIAQCSRFNLAEIVERHFSTMTQLMSLRHGLFSGLRNNSRTAALSSKEGKVSDYANQWRIVEQVRDIVLRLGKIPRECVRALVEAVAPGAHASFFASLNVEFEGEMASVKPAARAIDMKLVSKMVDTPANRKALREYLQEHPYAITHFDLESLEEVVVSCLSPGMDEELLLSLMHEDHKRSWESKRIASKITSMTTKHPLICLTAHHRRVDVVGMIHQEENGLEALRALMHMNVFSSTETDNKMIQKIVEDIAPKLNIPKVRQKL
eukprot:jgi/Bigna1/143766/aug1.81_g18474